MLQGSLASPSYVTQLCGPVPVYRPSACLSRAHAPWLPFPLVQPGCRAELFVSCEPGTYQLRTVKGPLQQQESCESTHCELVVQDILATINVVSSLLVHLLSAWQCRGVWHGLVHACA